MNVRSATFTDELCTSQGDAPTKTQTGRTQDQ